MANYCTSDIVRLTALMSSNEVSDLFSSGVLTLPVSEFEGFGIGSVRIGKFRNR